MILSSSSILKIVRNYKNLPQSLLSISYNYCSSFIRHVEPQEVYAPLQSKHALCSNFDFIIDTRTPDEFKEDHLPNAINIPVLSNHERKEVGMLYHKEEMNGRKLGAQLILRNIASHLGENVLLSSLAHNQGKSLIYCWRGNQRSNAFALVLSELIKSPVWVLTGGYRGFRKFLIKESEQLLDKFELKVISGLTGCGKSALLEALEARGHHVLHLERLAKHRGSILGSYSEDQPSQKAFDNHIWQSLRQTASLIDCSIESKSARPLLWVECESRVVGLRHLSEYLWTRMHDASRILIHASRNERVKHILKEYEHLTSSKSDQLYRFDFLGKHHSKARIGFWKTLALSENFEELVLHLLEDHYDPSYKSSRKRFFNSTDATKVIPLQLDCLDPDYIKGEAVDRLLQLADKSGVSADEVSFDTRVSHNQN